MRDKFSSLVACSIAMLVLVVMAAGCGAKKDDVSSTLEETAEPSKTVEPDEKLSVVAPSGVSGYFPD